jgi:NTE family protein
MTDYPVAQALRCPDVQTGELAAYPTRLAQVSDVTQQRLINWGYAICDAAMRAHVVPDAPAPSGFPYPAAGVGSAA